MNVVFNIEGSNFDSIVGRTAHIKYLSDQKFIKMFTCVFDKYFAWMFTLLSSINNNKHKYIR